MICTIADRARVAWLRRKMRADWDRRGREDAMHYVNTARRGWNEHEFFATGDRNVAELISGDMESVCQGRDPSAMRVLEIGCGVGRMTRALAGIFGEVHGVDISGEMVSRAQRFLRDTPNAHVYRNSGADLAVLGEMSFDFAFSFIVFQHIPSRRVISRYVSEVHRHLRPGSMFKFQVQGCTAPSLQRLRNDTWLGVGISEGEAARMAAENGFALVRSSGAGSQYYWLWYLKPRQERLWS